MKQAKADVLKFVTFQLGLDLFAVDVLSVDRVLRYTPPNAVPDVPPWIEGVVEHRGSVIPVVDLRRRVELADDSITPETRLLVFTSRDGYVGAIVDMVHEVSVVPAADISPPPALFRGLAGEFIRGIAKIQNQLVVILDVDRVLTSTDRIKFDQSALAAEGNGA
ncbi:MAG: chemotaxis protein CheW [Gemmatimonadaceae bacterium]